MQMDFRVYQLTYDGDLISSQGDLFSRLRELAKIPGEFGFEYCITREVTIDDSIITFCLSEEYAPNITSVDDERNSFLPDVSPFMNTYVALDLQEKRMLVQHRDYPANNLDRNQSFIRVTNVLDEAFQEIYNSAFNYLDTNRDVDDDDFLRVFENNRITNLRVKLFDTGRYIINGTQIFEEDEDLNNKWIDGFNSDESGTYEIVLKAPGRGGEGDLRYSPIARSLLNLVTKEIVELNYWDEDSGSNTMSRTDLKKFRISGINRDTQTITAIETISNEIYRRRQEIRNFRVTQAFQ